MPDKAKIFRSVCFINSLVPDPDVPVPNLAEISGGRKFCTKRILISENWPVFWVVKNLLLFERDVGLGCFLTPSYIPADGYSSTLSR